MDNALAIAGIMFILFGALKTGDIYPGSSITTWLVVVFCIWTGSTLLLAGLFSWTVALLITIGLPVVLLQGLIVILLIFGRTPSAEDPDTHNHM